VLLCALYLVTAGFLAWLYLHDLNRFGYWEDEIYSARDIGLTDQWDRQPEFRWSFSELTYRNDNHPPLYFWLLSKWATLFGFSEVSGRGLSVLCLALLWVVLWILARRWFRESELAAFWVLLAFGVSSPLYVLGHEARMYTLSLLLVSLSLLVFFEIVRRTLDRKGAVRVLLVCLAFVNAAGLYTHYYYAFFFLAEGLLGGWLWLKRRATAGVLAAYVASALLFLPWVPQILRQRERKYESGLWVMGPEGSAAYWRKLLEEGRDAVSQVLFGSASQAFRLALITVLAVALYLLVRRLGPRRLDLAPWLAALCGLSYILLAANDLYHHTITLTRVKYLFFLAVPLLLLYLRIALVNLTPARVILLGVLLGYNGLGLVREYRYQAHPDWRAMARAAERRTPPVPFLVADDDYFLCMSYYFKNSRTVLVEDSLSVYPEDFWYLVLYRQWNHQTQARVAELDRRFREVERIPVDRFTELVRYRLEGTTRTEVGPVPEASP
jgi:hypothetical protein